MKRDAMPKQLYVLRHAKSSWDDPGLPDHDRPLAPRGQLAVERLAEHVRTAEIQPDLVLCSSSRRTQETLEGVSPPGERLIEPELYAASAHEVLERLRRVPEDIGSLMVVGHNPAMQMLVLHLAAPGDDRSPLDTVERKFPTGAMATLSFDCAWSELGQGDARLVGFVRPKALPVPRNK
jgi:phosphohistidine phosphatase